MKHEIVIPEAIALRATRIKRHFQENQQTYLVGAGCLAAGYFLRKPAMAPVFNNMPTIAPVMNNIIENVVNNTVHNGGYTRKIIRCLETDAMWPSMKAAAEATGNHLTMMSKHCNGHLENLQGLHYVIEGLAAG